MTRSPNDADHRQIPQQPARVSALWVGATFLRRLCAKGGHRVSSEHRRSAGILIACVLFIVFLGYYNITATHLPLGAGQDEPANHDISQFIYSHHRLPVLPSDESELSFSRYGGTRALRPPLAFVTSASVAALFKSETNTELHKRFRKGSALLVAGAVAIAFLAVWTYFGSLILATGGAVLFGLMPQITFIASYNNDDSSAIFAGSLIILAMTVLFKKGVSWGSLLLLGLAGGIAIISKQSGWILAPSVVIFLLIFVLRHLPRVIVPMLAAMVLTMAVGGWWVLFNISHYGVNDPLLQKITATTAEKHSRFSPDREFGYQAQDVGVVDLLWRNHDAFRTKTIRSTIGHLDWLRLQVGQNHYRFYTLLFVLGIVAWLTRTGLLVFSSVGIDARKVVFESVLVFAIVFQLAAYLYINIHNDIQAQGKYLLPVCLAALILVIGGLQSAGQISHWVLRQSNRVRVAWTHQKITATLMVTLVCAAFILHVDALKSYVNPFYEYAFFAEPLQQIEFKDEFNSINIDPEYFEASHQLSNLNFDNNALTFTATGSDPWFAPRTDACQEASGNTLVRFTIESSIKSRFAVYWDDGDGFTEKNKAMLKYEAGTSEKHLWLGLRQCISMRIDPSTNPGTFTLRDLAIINVNVSRPKRN